MSKKRIAVIGKGTAGAMSLAHMVNEFPDDEVVWYFDPNKPAQSVGEGSTLNLPEDLNRNLHFFYHDLKKINGNYKNGVYKENWGTQDFMHAFVPPVTSMHFSAVDLQKYIYDMFKDKVKIVEEAVSPYDVDADFVLNATGTPKDFSEFHKSEYIPVNAAHVVQCDWDFPRFDYTLAYAGRHGWIFGIPLQNRCSIGYLYNKDISTIEDLQQDMQDVFEKYNLTPSSQPNNLNFNHYFRKNNYEDGGRIVHNGNASFFLEPLEALSFAVTGSVYHHAAAVWKGNMDVEAANNEYIDYLKEIELMIMMHYAVGSRFNTPFWDYAKKLGIERMKQSVHTERFQKMYELSKNRINNKIFPTLEEEFYYAGWISYSWEQNLLGLGAMPLIEELMK